MKDQYPIYEDEMDDLLRRLDELFPEPKQDEPAHPDDDIPEALRADEPVTYRNYANNYGAVRNYANGYGTGARQEEASAQQPLPVYNGDYRRPAQRRPVPEPGPRPEPEPPKPEPVPETQTPPARKRRGCGCLVLPMALLALVVAAALVFALILPAPVGRSDQNRKGNTATILLVGTDAEGERTDTMMLLYLSGPEKRVGLLSLPRDTYTITAAGNGAKLNSAYVRNGMGETGMEGLLDYVQDILGYRPDGYLMVGMDIVPKIVDAMGGLEVEVPMSFELEGTVLEEGLQSLNGLEVLQLLRYRKGYAMQDLGRIEVQRMVISAAMSQWLRPDRIPGALEALTLVRENCMTDLELPELAWIAKTIALGAGSIESNTLPGYADYIGDASYYILNREEVAALLNESYNPFTTEIRVEDLNIAP